MTVTVSLADLSTADVVQLIDTHAAFCAATSPPGSCHFLPASALDVPEITLWAARDGADVVGVAALKALAGGRGEIKSMHVAAERRGKRIGQALLEAIQKEAARRGYRSLWLETGTMAAFAPARALYERNGFESCPPFDDYFDDPNSACYTKTLMAVETSR